MLSEIGTAHHDTDIPNGAPVGIDFGATNTAVDIAGAAHIGPVAGTFLHLLGKDLSHLYRETSEGGLAKLYSH